MESETDDIQPTLDEYESKKEHRVRGSPQQHHQEQPPTKEEEAETPSKEQERGLADHQRLDAYQRPLQEIDRQRKLLLVH